MDQPLSEVASPKKCIYCGTLLPEGASFCPKCGKETRMKPISLWSAVLAIIVSIFLAPFGLIFAIKYLKRPERVARWLGISCIVLTTVSIILTLVVAKGFISTYYGSLDSLNNPPY